MVYRSLIRVNYFEEMVQADQFVFGLVVTAANPQMRNLSDHDNEGNLVLKLFAYVKNSPSQL